ncbi:C1QL [Mytilus edulis]|uniref:C1QL n=1 Tax=Mytilus edulis TaxID=6550 RepID=A0A8S3RSR7_MYTED|nr:C1QL [Mytilus edulis]
MGISTMFIKILWIIVFLATFLDVRADTTLQQNRYEERLNVVEAVLLKQSNEIEDLKSVVQTQKNEITQLKMTLSKVKQLHGIHDKSISFLRRLIMKPKINLQSATEENTMLKRDNQYKNLKRISEMVKSEVSINRASRPHHTIAFDLVKTNIHNSYNNFTGVFTAPIHGAYGFIYALRMPCNTYGTFEIMKNDQVEGTIHVNVQNGCSGQFSTGSIVIVLNIGDSVYVRTHSTITPTGLILSGIDGCPYFAGWLISSL